MNWKEQIVLGLLIGPFLIWRAYANYFAVPRGAPWGAHLDLILAPAGLAILWAGFDAFRKRNDPQFLKRVRAKSRDQAFGLLVICGFMTVPFFWPRPFWTQPLTYGSFVLLGLNVFFVRHAILCYRAPASAVKGTNSPLKVLLSGMAIMVFVSEGTYIFLSLDALRDRWIEMRVFGFAGPFFATLVRVIVGVLCWGAALFLGAKLLRRAIQNSRRQP